MHSLLSEACRAWSLKFSLKKILGKLEKLSPINHTKELSSPGLFNNRIDCGYAQSILIRYVADCGTKLIFTLYPIAFA